MSHVCGSPKLCEASGKEDEWNRWMKRSRGSSFAEDNDFDPLQLEMSLHAVSRQLEVYAQVGEVPEDLRPLVHLALDGFYTIAQEVSELAEGQNDANTTVMRTCLVDLLSSIIRGIVIGPRSEVSSNPSSMLSTSAATIASLTPNSSSSSLSLPPPPSLHTSSVPHANTVENPSKYHRGLDDDSVGEEMEVIAPGNARDVVVDVASAVGVMAIDNREVEDGVHSAIDVERSGLWEEGVRNDTLPGWVRYLILTHGAALRLKLAGLKGEHHCVTP